MNARDQESRQAAAFAASRTDRDRTLRAVHRLETALAMASEGNAWLPEVTADLGALQASMAAERSEFDRADALLALIAEGHPRRFRSRVRNLREQYDDLLRQVGSLRDQLAHDHEAASDAGDLRHRIGWIIQALHHCRAQQTDLVYEALSLDLGER
jgi:DNA repair ATPase RecN